MVGQVCHVIPNLRPSLSPGRGRRDLTMSAASVTRVVEAIGPHRLVGAVVTGFQRGSKQLGWPTANLDPRAFEQKLDAATEGVYVGWAAIDEPSLPAESRAVHKAILSIGWNVRTASFFSFLGIRLRSTDTGPVFLHSHTLMTSRSARSRRTWCTTLASATFTARR